VGCRDAAVAMNARSHFSPYPNDLMAVVSRHFQWNRGGLDGHRMMTADDTGTNVWGVDPAREGMASGGGVAVGTRVSPGPYRDLLNYTRGSGHWTGS
jgi:hypothetical protein